MAEYMSYEEYLEKVKEGIVTDQGNCPVTPLLVMLQGKWKTQVLYEFCIHDKMRFGELKKDFFAIGPGAEDALELIRSLEPVKLQLGDLSDITVEMPIARAGT